ncbi:hypothetical protein H8M03_00005 [Sphingomonas sabuli]|uniref:Uncharacterized protein n=1 Tax=Sphingomonas sabuli TaxID=2764186 RepID=A0A7G9L2F3_9SPHN|nr:hypothetical protein [Sphingomonas sabuli]QNM82802.1 hypothetical protein H8M03_00005 [Sphingomonas sabuli]
MSFRDEIIPWIDDGTGGEDDDEDEEVIDESSLFGHDVIDTGITSGADPTAWDPIGIERQPGSPGNAGSTGPDKKPDAGPPVG